MRAHDANPNDRKPGLILHNFVAQIRHPAWDRNQRIEICHGDEGAESEQGETVADVVGGMSVDRPLGTVSRSGS